MHSAWIKGHPDPDKRRKQVKTYKPVLDDLIQILEKEVIKKDSVRDYEVPNWELRQIAVNEFNQALKDLMELIKIKD